ncbi:KRAB-A domain-containing protein 2 [Trichonephila clavipes]|nr:KRAB-A domain-containing protein 2 [Trichonephila clavipes]
MKQLFDDELPKTRVKAARKGIFLNETTYKKLITDVQKTKMTNKMEPRAYWLLNSYDVMLGENKRKETIRFVSGVIVCGGTIMSRQIELDTFGKGFRRQAVALGRGLYVIHRSAGQQQRRA